MKSWHALCFFLDGPFKSRSALSWFHQLCVAVRGANAPSSNQGGSTEYSCYKTGLNGTSALHWPEVQSELLLAPGQLHKHVDP